jgi:hypothetical protein
MNTGSLQLVRTTEDSLQWGLDLPAVLKEPRYMSEPKIKVVGRRKAYSGGLEGLQGFQELCNRLRGDRPFVPRGHAYKFKTHEEADEWLLKMMTRSKAALPR